MGTVHHTHTHSSSHTAPGYRDPDTPLDKYWTKVDSTDQNTCNLARPFHNPTDRIHSICGMGSLVVYDLDYRIRETGDNLQALIEEPEIYMIAPISSSPLAAHPPHWPTKTSVTALASTIKTLKPAKAWKSRTSLLWWQASSAIWKRNSDWWYIRCKDHMMFLMLLLNLGDL